MIRVVFRAALLLAGLALVVSFILDLKHLAPPRPVVIESGPVGGSYHKNAIRYAEHLEGMGFAVTVRPNPQSLESIAHVNGGTPVADIAFTAQAVNPANYPNVRSAGAIEVQPLFAFFHKQVASRLRVPSDLTGLRLVMPPERSATSEAVRAVLGLYGVTPANTTFTYLPIADAVAELKADRHDAGLFMLAAENPLVTELGTEDDLWLPSFAAAQAVAGKLPWLRTVRLPVGAFDIHLNRPSQDTDLVGATVNVIVNKDLHPAVLYGLLQAMDQVHSGATLVTPAGEFPSLLRTAVPAHPLAAQYVKTGVPWLYRNLPPFVARMVDRYLLIGLAFLFLIEGYRVVHYFRELREWLANHMALRILTWLDRRLARGEPPGRASRALLQIAESIILHHAEHSRAQELLGRVRARLGPA